MLFRQKKVPTVLLTSSAIALVMLLNGCSDEQRHTSSTSSHSSSQAKPVAIKFNAAPVAHAGSDQIVRVGEVVTLNGTQSADPDHDLMTFSWEQKSGPTVEVVNSDTLTPSFIAPSSKQALSFSLTVSDGQDESEASLVSITISNRAPLANAGRTIVAKRGSKVMLDGSSSVDLDKDDIKYQWTQVYGDAVSLEDGAKISPSFTMPSTSGYLIFALTVTDGIDSSIADTVAVKVSNTAPIAKVTLMTDNIISGNTVQLDGSKSSDADGDKLTYSWSQILGSPVMLSGGDTPKPEFTAPERPDHLVFELTVSDGEFTSHSDSLVVSIKNEIKSFEEAPSIEKIIQQQDEVSLTPKNRTLTTLAVADAPAPVDNFLPEVTEGFTPTPIIEPDGKLKPLKPAKKHKAHWSYEGDGAPENWASLDSKFALCGDGTTQSPINIETAGLEANTLPIEFNYGTSVINVVNNGHTIQVNYDSGSYANIGGKRYDLLQFHFHSPSEHTIDGKTANMVAHLVHKSEDGGLAIVGVLFKEGKENDFLKPIWSNLPLDTGSKTESPSTIFAANMLPETQSYFHYSGSLTTPPCSEGVNWNIMTTLVEASPAQIEAFTSIFEKSVRPVQPLNDRKISLQ